MFAPEGTSPEIVNKLNTTINLGLADDNAKARLAQFDAFAQPGSPGEFAAHIARMGTAWGELG